MPDDVSSLRSLAGLAATPEESLELKLRLVELEADDQVRGELIEKCAVLARETGDVTEAVALWRRALEFHGGAVAEAGLLGTLEAAGRDEERAIALFEMGRARGDAARVGSHAGADGPCTRHGATVVLVALQRLYRLS